MQSLCWSAEGWLTSGTGLYRLYRIPSLNPVDANADGAAFYVNVGKTRIKIHVLGVHRQIVKVSGRS